MSHFKADDAQRASHTHAVAAAALLAPILAVLAPLGLAPLLAVLAVAVLGLRRAQTGAWLAGGFDSVVAISCALAAWMLVTYFWTIDGGAFAHKYPGLLAGIAAGAFFLDGARDLDEPARRTVRRLLIVGVAIALALVLVERFDDAQLRRLLSKDFSDGTSVLVSFNRSMTVLALLIWPAALAMWRCSPIFAIALWAAGFAVIQLFYSGAAIVALVLGAAGFALVLWRPRRAAVAAGVALAALILASPLIASRLPDKAVLKPYLTPMTSSWYHRILIWQFVADKIAERPLAGWGFTASRNISGGKRDLDVGAPALPLHPHNASLQLWLELGLPGAAFGALLVVVVMSRIGRMGTATVDKAASTGMVLGAITIGNLSYGAWQSWWLATIWISAGLMCAVIEPVGGEIDRAP